MPSLSLTTNLPRSRITDDILKGFAGIIAEVMGVDERRVFVNIKCEAKMLWDDKPGEYVLGALRTVKSLNSDDTKDLTKPIFEFVQKCLGIPQNKMYISIVSGCKRSNIAMDGHILTANRIFAELPD